MPLSDETKLRAVCSEVAELDAILADPLTHSAEDDIIIRRTWPALKARLLELAQQVKDADALRLVAAEQFKQDMNKVCGERVAALPDLQQRYEEAEVERRNAPTEHVKDGGMCEYRGCHSIWREKVCLCGVIPVHLCVRHWREFVLWRLDHPMRDTWEQTDVEVEAHRLCGALVFSDAHKAIEAQRAAFNHTIAVTRWWLGDHLEQRETDDA